tara:strand:+ start:1744 stop:1968 length:225 start_codon:yes stop_codon:yes gene_type:complete
MSSHLIISRTKINGHDTLVFKYRASQDMAFCFTLLSEVGEPWQNEAKQLLAKKYPQGVVVHEIADSPYMVTLPK